MQLIGVLKSPYVRRTAISLQMLGVAFEHRSLSTFDNEDEYRAINPALKAPTLVCDDGTVMLDSSLILQYAEAALSLRSLWPDNPAGLQRDFALVSMAMAACDKAVQYIYEVYRRPESAQLDSWRERVVQQSQGAFTELERQLQQNPQAVASDECQLSVTAAVVWQFVWEYAGELLQPLQCPGLEALSRRMESHPVFRQFSLSP
ncbi:glutathione S-transferase family protein [Pseudomaricurvus sp. HS19]|uniref:glutathione S-transferase family protein n=1 Tax=Pseudomaricurvus sp. HS19 TaxID=2692626 RepID=UPI0013699D91|nr:glutathione S-transferase family protein [Pseudomaricurvus sp. HS19]MYM64748.1 glutathione S-transferase [Pseudomaricurvus sp. HS19]